MPNLGPIGDGDYKKWHRVYPWISLIYTVSWKISTYLYTLPMTLTCTACDTMSLYGSWGPYPSWYPPNSPSTRCGSSEWCAFARWRGERALLGITWCFLKLKNIGVLGGWLIPPSKWVITPVISGLTFLIPFIIWVTYCCRRDEPPSMVIPSPYY